MYSRYKLYPSISQTSTFSYERREPDQVLNRSSNHSLYVGRRDYEYRFDGGIGGIPASTSNGSLIDFDIDTSDFMNMKSPFPWDHNQPAYYYTDPNHSVRYSFQSFSSTTQGSYFPKTSQLSGTNESLSGTRQSRESILIPDFPQDLAYHHVKARESRPANLRTTVGEPAIHSATVKRCSLSYKRSVGQSQPDCLAELLGSQPSRSSLTPELSFESSNTPSRPPTPSLSSSSTVTSSPASWSRSSPSDSRRILDVFVTNTDCVGLSSAGGAKSWSDPRSSDRGSLGAASKGVQRKISGPLPNSEYPSKLSLTTAPFSAEICYPEGAFQPRRKTPKPPSSTQLPPSLVPSTTQAEPPSWWDLDDDTNDRPSQHRNLPTKLSIPHIRLRADSSSKKATSVPASTIKRGGKDSIAITANLIHVADSDISCPASKPAPAHIPFSSFTPAAAPTNVSQAMFLTKSSVGSRLLGPGRRRSAETLKKTRKPNTLKVGSSSKNRKRSSGRRLRAWFRRLCG